MPEKEYILDVDLNVRIRCWHSTEKGQVRGFAMQLEIFTQDHWQTVIRYDTAHGFAHCDAYRKNGSHVKTALGMDFRTARAFAQDDLLTNWQRYISRFLEG